jgi:hypothetical protein
MTRGSMESRNGQTDRNRSRNGGGEAPKGSHMPPDLTQAQVTNVEKAEKDLAGEHQEIQQYRFRQRKRKSDAK